MEYHMYDSWYDVTVADGIAYYIMAITSAKIYVT